MGNLDVLLNAAVREADRAWNANSELRWLFGKPGASPFRLLSTNVGTLLKLIQRKRQLIHFVPPNPKDRMLAHAVTGSNDYYNTKDRKFAARQTVLLNTGFFADHVGVTFKQATAKERASVNAGKRRALILLHEARHLYSASGHGVDPASHDGTWNDYILWTGFLGKKVQRRVG